MVMALEMGNRIVYGNEKGFWCNVYRLTTDTGCKKEVDEQLYVIYLTLYCHAVSSIRIQ